MLKEAKGETLVRTDLKGQQFLIEDSSDCNVYLLDKLAALTVDSIKNCVVVTGPVEGSAFLRDCENCTFVVAAGQIRTRDCKNCKIFLFSGTEPVIEASKGMEIGCYGLQYFEIANHFEKAGMSVFNNKWSEGEG